MLAAVSVLSAFGCSSSDESAAPRVAAVHRASEACSTERPVGDGATGRPGCQRDAECTDGMNGRCMGGITGNGCTYDACASDADCAAGTACLCRAGGYASVNACVPAACRVDADCGAYSCSPSKDDCDLNGYRGLYCHGAADECVDDADCPKPSSAIERSYCRWTPEKGHWACYTTNCMN
jgi:hypothetical protein